MRLLNLIFSNINLWDLPSTFNVETGLVATWKQQAANSLIEDLVNHIEEDILSIDNSNKTESKENTNASR